MHSHAKWYGSVFCLLMSVIVVFISTASVCQNFILQRSAKTLRTEEILVWESIFVSPFRWKYDFQKDTFVRLVGHNYKLTSYTMLGYGITNNIELLIHLPLCRAVMNEDGKTVSATGIGDVSFHTRLLLIDDSRFWPAINIGVYARVPTGDTVEKPAMGKGAAGLGFTMAITKKLGPIVGHIKLGFIFNGIDDRKIDLGDSLYYMVKSDFVVYRSQKPVIKELALMLGLSGNWSFSHRDDSGKRIKNSHQYRPLSLVPMIRWTLWKGFFLRPKAIFPIKRLATGGKFFVVQYVLDLKYSF